MKKQIEAVREFHNAFGQRNNYWPQHIKVEDYKLRHKLMAEENDEYLEACEANDIVGIADALGDQMYILCGTILKHGLQHIIEHVFAEIHASNMSKLGEDGMPILREDGKILKGDGYFKPDLEQFFVADSKKKGEQ
jgi:predicted HAD superfamily Cof-like phosphohydrolase